VENGARIANALGRCAKTTFNFKGMEVEANWKTFRLPLIRQNCEEGPVFPFGACFGSAVGHWPRPDLGNDGSKLRLGCKTRKLRWLRSVMSRDESRQTQLWQPQSAELIIKLCAANAPSER
jgi:hypothetical protein